MTQFQHVYGSGRRPPLAGLPTIVPHRQKARVEGMAVLLWLVTLGLLVRMVVFVRPRTSEYMSQIDSQAAAEIILVILATLFAMGSRNFRPIVSLLLRSSAGILVLYYAFGAVSAIWSVFPTMSAFRALEVLSQALAIFVALTYCRSLEKAQKLVLLMAVAVAVMGIIGRVKLVGAYSSLQDLHTNSYSTCAAIACCYCIGEIFSKPRGQKQPMLWAFAIMLFMLMAVGTSSASIIATLAGVAVAAVLCRNRALLLICLGVGASVAVLASSETIYGLLFPGKTVEQIDSLSGRMTLWTDFGERIEKSPILGYGFSMLARTGTTYTTNTHNFFLSVLGGTGVAGLIFVFIWLFWLTVEIVRSIRHKRIGSVGCAAAMTAGLVNSMGSAFLGETWTSATFVFMCFIGIHLLFVRVPRQLPVGVRYR